MSQLHGIRSSEDLAEILALSERQPVMLLKHSTRCPVSARAHEEFRKYAGEATARGTECAIVLVVEERTVSQEIAATLGVPHHSPQAILVKNRRAVWNDSHYGITAASLSEAEGVRGAGGAPE